MLKHLMNMIVEAIDDANISVVWYAEKMGHTKIASVIRDRASTF
jgi:hypothetical protein